MKSIKIIYLLFLFTFVPDISNGVEIITDKAEYRLGDQAVVLVKLDDSLILGREYNLFSKFNNLNTKAYRLSDTIFGVVVSDLPHGNNILEFDVYTRNVENSFQLEREIYDLHLHKLMLERRRSGETDIGKISDLQAAIDTCDQSINIKKSLLENERTFHSTMSKVISVSTGVRTRNTLELEIYPSENIPWGEIGSIGLYYPTEPEDEIRIEAKLDNTPVIMDYDPLSGVWTYYFISEYADRGSHTFGIKIYNQDIARANLFKSAMKNATHRRLEVSIIRDVAVVPSLRAFYSAEIDDINLIIQALSGVVNGTESVLAEGNISFSIVAPPELLTISKTSEIVVKGNESFYTLRLLHPPSGQAFVSINSDDPDIKFWVDGENPSSSLVLMFDEINWKDTVRIKFKVNDNGLMDGGRLGTVFHSISGGGFDSEVLPELKVSIKDKVALLVCNPDGLWIDPWSTVWLEVSLPKEPTGDVTVNFNETSGYLYLGGPLYFDASNWNIPQMLQIDSFENTFGRYTLEAVSEGDSSIGGCAVELDLQGEYWK